jgi:hypothetical protein
MLPKLRRLVALVPPLLDIRSCAVCRLDKGPVSRRSSTQTKSHPIAAIRHITWGRYRSLGFRKEGERKQWRAVISAILNLTVLLTEIHFVILFITDSISSFALPAVTNNNEQRMSLKIFERSHATQSDNT